MQSPNPLLAVRSDVEHIVWPAVPLGQAAVLTALLQQFEQSQWLPRAQVVQRQHALLVPLAAHLAQHSPHFRQRLEKAGLTPQALATPEGLQRLPTLTRRDVQEAGAALFCDAVPKEHLPLNEGQSSGSTGQPVTVRKTALNALIWHANMMREHFWHKRDFAGKIMNVRAMITELRAQKSWGAPVNILVPSGDVLAVPITFSAQRLLEILDEFKPQNLVIYPNALEGLVACCEKDGKYIACVEHIWSIGETLRPELRERARAVFSHAAIEDDYSCNEVGIMALQCPESGLYHVMAESVIIEVLDDDGQPCAEGETGRVVVTDLHNHATPMIRYEIGDYAQVGGACPCGRGLPVLASIRGRKRNLVAKPDGTRHWPPLAPNVFASQLPIRQFQLVQHSLEDIEVRLVSVPQLDEAQEAHLTGYLYKALGHPFPLRFTYFEGRVPLPANGKFEDFICLV